MRKIISVNRNVDVDFSSLASEIKNDILSTRNKVVTQANFELILLYHRIGRIISENAKYGNDFINFLSNAIKVEFSDLKGFSPRNLARMKKFFMEYPDIGILPTPLAKLPWSVHCLLIDKVLDKEIRVWYAEKYLSQSWSFVVLEHQIDLKLYERQGDNSRKLTNFSKELSTDSCKIANGMLKDPYIFELVGLSDNFSEKQLEEAMLEKIKNVLLELGKGFSFVGNQYKISTDNKDYYIDLLFYHLELRCYVVVELKTVDFEPSFIGQLKFYVTAVDETIKRSDDGATIGLLLCKNKDRKSVEWALKSVNVPVGVASYEVSKYLPSEDEINSYL